MTTYYVPDILEAAIYVLRQVPKGTSLIQSSKSQSVLRRHSLTVLNVCVCGGGMCVDTLLEGKEVHAKSLTKFSSEKKSQEKPCKYNGYFLLEDIFEATINHYTIIQIGFVKVAIQK